MSTLRVKKLVSEAKLPSRGSSQSIGYDLYSLQDITIPGKGLAVISTGISLAIPKGHYGRIATRSSMAKVGVFVVGGVIDPDYRGEIKVCLLNHKDNYIIEKGDRIAQLILEKASILPVEERELDETDRGENGFGSTGK
jgi:deoxyuridine 5'-triphosphate nucleotidohydrolase